MVITKLQPPIKLGDNESNGFDDYQRCHTLGAHLAVRIIIHNILFVASKIDFDDYKLFEETTNIFFIFEDYFCDVSDSPRD